MWRSLGHVDMPSCRELVESLSRTLFNLVDTNTTQQVIESKSKRIDVLKALLKLGFKSMRENSSNIKFDDKTKLEIVPFSSFFEVNTTRLSPNSSLFSYVNIKNSNVIVLSNITASLSTAFDSMFVYSNLKNISSLNALVCKSFEANTNKSYTCTEFRDLTADFGRLLPLESQRGYLMTINLIDFKKLVQNGGYQYLILNIVTDNEPENFTGFVNFDFYSKSDRFNLNLQESTTFRISNTDGSMGAFTRFYLPFFKHIWQAYNLKM